MGAIYLLTTIPDREGDRYVGKRTMAVVLPRWGVLLMALLMMFGAAVVAYYSGYPLLLYTSGTLSPFSTAAEATTVLKVEPGG